MDKRYIISMNSITSFTFVFIMTKPLQNISAIIVIIKTKNCLGFSREPRGILFGLVRSTVPSPSRRNPVSDKNAASAPGQTKCGQHARRPKASSLISHCVNRQQLPNRFPRDIHLFRSKITK